MKVSDAKIVEITESELFDLWLERGMDDIMSFPEYIITFEALGCTVLKGGADECSASI